MSSGIFGSSSSDPFANSFGGPTSIKPNGNPFAAPTASTDPFAHVQGGPTPIQPFANPFGTVQPQTHAHPFQPQNMGQPGGGQKASGGQQSGQQGQSPSRWPGSSVAWPSSSSVVRTAPTVR
ncbi:hypothetical protein [Methylobacterium sp. 13MFTsu3.1M2]|uniref:hypothetical protein n=1 Tax=Methylobacterium sp. 13MFTsu3.1M2 TaxID=1502776 RepID=UPI0008EE4417|nr:hypothetical protein [Methylobacterium sp. 13MFTsu3.1M2]SFE92086.1 hypothetical protein SAMN02799627_04725 [Methylobacterium sp. 13MFTsu3.1M2]